jgi:hypothetical protein
MTAEQAKKVVPCWFSLKNSKNSPTTYTYVTTIKLHYDAIKTEFILGYTEFSFVVLEFGSTAVSNFVNQPPGEEIIASTNNKALRVVEVSENIKKSMVASLFEMED